ncbi:RNA polymerase factor sigma-54 [Natronogracilivirga saccharolytica]|uniref:RNA polymerase factor sigma-54 n=1 Tax=Natronogracilivirga saccharolytica TaxID=2812953 RepID=A0A8J7S2Z2_9BACT|nr:RNA polymerase factor sigma-54 [Natronogracilivirga saccharolytica]MBP3191113.1 RNA polymerase factor sigma-54 [Natronogracilivirga saccharolytica]
MIRQSQSIGQRQSLQQRLSPQQIQYIKLLQLPTLLLEQKVKQEIETNPVLEVEEENIEESAEQPEQPENETDENPEPASAEEDTAKQEDSSDDGSDDVSPVDENEEIDWETYFHDDEGGYSAQYSKDQEEWQNLPKPYKTSFMENIERQVALLDLDERQRKVADQIIGSIDPDGYLRRDIDSIIDAVAFNDGVVVSNEEAEHVLRKIQKLDPPGIAARNLRECLVTQLEVMESSHPSKKVAMDILTKAWPQFEKKHYDKIQQKLNLTEDQLREAYQIIMMLDPKPGETDEYLNPDQFIVPDFEVCYEEAAEGQDPEAGEFVIRLNSRNMPNIRISRHYKEMWDEMNRRDSRKDNGGNDKNGSDRQTRQFIKDKMESARWFIESIRQRQHTLMAVMKTIVALQEDFFKTGSGIKPMILKDVADRIQMDISTVSRVVNGKYVQTPFGVYELKYFFTEGMETESGESVSNREIKNILLELVQNEDKSSPLSDKALADALEKKGYPVARRTISKYREQLNIPVARMRKSIG